MVWQVVVVNFCLVMVRLFRGSLPDANVPHIISDAAQSKNS